MTAADVSALEAELDSLVFDLYVSPHPSARSWKGVGSDAPR